MTKWKCDRAGAICFKPCYAEIECCESMPHKCLFGDTRTPIWKRVSDEPEQKPETTLPDWCKFGAWAYGGGRYGRITGICHTSGEIDIGETGYFIPVAECSEARLLPWAPKEAIGKVVKNACCVGIITYADKFKCIVGTKVITLKELSEEYTEQDGAPCGKLEHLEDGEWKA